MIITIDGGAGTGKTTMTRLLAVYLGFEILNTGNLYRTVAFLGKLTDRDLSSEKDMLKVVADMVQNSLYPQVHGSQIILGVQDVSRDLASLEVSQGASVVAKHPSVREGLLHVQREMGLAVPNCIVEGRDAGTVLFPDASIKFFFTASAEARALRRKKDMPDRSFEEILADIKDRDERERTRDTAPMLPAEDAFMLDTTNYTIGQLLDTLIAHCQGNHE